jgi:hypothetical protein
VLTQHSTKSLGKRSSVKRKRINEFAAMAVKKGRHGKIKFLGFVGHKEALASGKLLLPVIFPNFAMWCIIKRGYLSRQEMFARWLSLCNPSWHQAAGKKWDKEEEIGSGPIPKTR